LGNRRCRAVLECYGRRKFLHADECRRARLISESHRAIIEARPAWATGAFAIAVFGGALGCLLLLLKKSAAYYLFIASLLGVIVQLIPTLGILGSTIDFSPPDIVMIILSDDYSDAAGGGGVFDLVFEAGREQGLDQSGNKGHITNR
jgi:hypothetical protein